MIKLLVNNQQAIEITQEAIDGIIKVETTKQYNSGTVSETNYNISAGDMVMLLNYYRYIKTNDIPCDFINPNGSI